MNSNEFGLIGESYVAKKLDTLGIRYWWNPSHPNKYGADFLTEYGIIDVKIARPRITIKKGKRGTLHATLWTFNCHHHGEKQTMIDIFIFVIINYKNNDPLYLIMPQQTCNTHVFTISERQIENGKYGYFLNAWDIIKTVKDVENKDSWNPIIDYSNYRFELHKALKEAEMYQSGLSIATGISTTAISLIMSGKHIPSDGEKQKIEKILGPIKWTKNKLKQH